jgi:phosphotransferase system  glucose/maltose/N-acetylglucosamine-specific IIC component
MGFTVISPHLRAKAHDYHEQIPGLRKLPLASLVVIAAVGVVNCLVWVGVAIALVCCCLSSYLLFLICDAG